MDMVKVALVAALALALPAHAADSILDNPAAVEAMCGIYAGYAGIVMNGVNHGATYATERAAVANAQASASGNSRMLPRDRAFVNNYTATAVDFAFAYPIGTAPEKVKADALAQCRAQFGR